MSHSNTSDSPDQSLLRTIDDVAVTGDERSVTLSEVNLRVALDLAATGMAIIPVRVFHEPSGQWQKRPAIKGWQRSATVDAEQIESWWSQFPQALPGIELGRSGLLVIDADRHDPSADGVGAFAALRASYRDESPPHPQTLTAGLGEHHFYRQPSGRVLGNSEGNLPPGINVRGAGGFVVAPGAVRLDGAIWEPTRGVPGLTDAFRAGAIPELPDWLVQVLSAKRRQAPDRLSEIDLVPSGRDQAYATAALEACISELGRTPPGERNTKLNAVSYHLGRMIARDWIDERVVVGGLLMASESNRLVEDDGANAVRETIESGTRAGMAHPHKDLPDQAPEEPSLKDEPESISPPLIPVLWDGDAPVNRIQWLVCDLIPMGSVGLMVGESRAGKTFLAIGLARALSQGSPFVTKPARPGGTLYVAAEAPGTIPGRLQAARLGPLEPFLDQGGCEKPTPLSVAVLSKPPNLLIEEGRTQLVATALDVSETMQARFGNPLRLIVIDTMLAAFDIRDWNDPAETRRVMNALSWIAEETSTVVLGIHHHGKDVTRGAAGSYALTAAADFVLSVFADIEADGTISNRRITASKLRDGPTGWGCDFELKPFKIGVNDDGENITSAFVEPKTVTAGFGRIVRGQKKRAPAQSSTAFAKAFGEALEQVGIDRTCPGSDRVVRAVRVSDLRASFAREYYPGGGAGKAGDAQRQAFTRALKAALADGLVRQDAWDGVDWLWRDDE